VTVRMVAWQICGLLGLLSGRLTVGHVGCHGGCQSEWLSGGIDFQPGWLSGTLAIRQVGCQAERLSGRLAIKQVGCQAGFLAIGQVGHQLLC
jgi:hypothetical protein